MKCHYKNAINGSRKDDDIFQIIGWQSHRVGLDFYLCSNFIDYRLDDSYDMNQCISYMIHMPRLA